MKATLKNAYNKEKISNQKSIFTPKGNRKRRKKLNPNLEEEVNQKDETTDK